MALSAILTLTGCPPSTPQLQGSILNLYSIDPLTLDPAVSGELTSHEYVMQIFGGLVRLDENLQPVPDIAKEWQISDDGKTYTFNLRQDVKFQSGKGVTAGDFKYSWERALDPATGSLTAPTYLSDIVGAADVLAGKTKEISGVKVIDDYTLQVAISAPKSYFLSKLTYPTSFVVDISNVKSGKNWWRNPDGTGPLKLNRWDEGNQLILEKNQLYYGEVAKVDYVVFKMWAGVPMDMYETGAIDVTGIGTDYIDKASDNTGPFYSELVIAPELGFDYIGYDTSRPPFNDANIRRAFSMAIDKDKIVSLIFRDMVQKADGVLPPGLPGYNKDIKGLPYDVEKAKKLIADSQYGDASKLPAITITTSGWGGMVSQELEAIIYQWKQNLGVDVSVRQIDPQRFLYHLKEETDEMYYTGWIADYPHPQDFLEVLFRTGTETNYGKYSNAEFDSLLDEAAAEQDTSKSIAIYQQAEQKLVDDAACLPIWFGKNYLLVKPYVEGYRLNPLGIPQLNQVTVEPH